MDNITLDEFRVSDIPKIRDIFCEAFELECYGDNRFVHRHLLDHYLCGYLMEADHAVIARSENGIEGFLFGCSGDRNGNPIYAIMKAYHRLFLPFSRGGRGYIHCKRLIDNADEALRLAAPPPEGELLLYVVRRESRGKGVGRQMLTAFKKWLQNRGIARMQLFTDNWSDVDYYRKRGYEQLGVEHIQFFPGDESEFYLFAIDVNKI